MGDYQDRKDIDYLYSLIWDNEHNQLKLLTKEEYDELVSLIKEGYFTKAEVMDLITRIPVGNGNGSGGESVDLSDYVRKDEISVDFDMRLGNPLLNQDWFILDVFLVNNNGS